MRQGRSAVGIEDMPENWNGTLLEGLASGDRSALRQIYIAHKDALLTVAASMTGDLPMAEDALQETFVSLARTRPRLPSEQRLKAYLFRSCINKVRDMFRRRVHCSPIDETVLTRTTGGNTPSELAEQSDDVRLIYEALQSLPTKQREVVALHCLGGLTFRESAQLLDTSINTAQSRYRYAMSKLKDELKGGAHV